MLSLHCHMGFSLVAAKGSYSLLVVRKLLIVVAFPVAELRPLGTPASGVGGSWALEPWINYCGTQA